MDNTKSRCCGAVLKAVPGKVQALVCMDCHLTVEVLHAGVRQDIERFLLDLTKPPGVFWLQVKEPKDRLVHHVLSQLLYCPELSKGEVPYDTPDEDDIVKLAWCNHTAVGFYTVKPQGARSRPASVYCKDGLPTLDTAFVLPSHRGRGLGLSILQDFTSSYPDSDLALSYPLSDAMWMVLKKYLMQNVSLRRTLWLVKGDCEEGNMTLIWLCLKKLGLLED